MMMQRELFRPVGLYELRLIAAGGYRAFPPRLPTQPIFYPVLNLEYATQTNESGSCPLPQQSNNAGVGDDLGLYCVYEPASTAETTRNPM